MRYKAAIFDMDGTVLDSLADMHNAVNFTLEHFGFPLNTPAQTRAFVGNGAARLIRLSLPDGTDEAVFNVVLAYYKDYYDKNCRILTSEYTGISDMLLSLREKGIKLSLVSNKPDSAVQELNAYFFDGLFEYAVGESEGVRRKPAPDGVLKAAECMGFPVEECVYIGDSEVDVATANNCGMDCISVTWGFRDREQLIAAGAAVLIDSVSELEAYLSRSEK